MSGKDWIIRNGEALVMLGVFLFGLWTALQGGWLLAAFGGLVMAIAALLLRGALLRMRFVRQSHRSGVVLLDERRVGYFGPETGGFFELGELELVELMTYPTGAHWTLRGGGQELIVPAAAEGADQLFDVFASLPGFPMAHATRLLEGAAPSGTHVLWPESDGRPARAGSALPPRQQSRR